VGIHVIPRCKVPKVRSVVTLVPTTEVLPSATLTVTGELIGIVGRASSCTSSSSRKLAEAPLSNKTLTVLPARIPSNSIHVEDKSGPFTTWLLFNWTKESKIVAGRGISLTLRILECTDNL
jgi:hypothetical protein